MLQIKLDALCHWDWDVISNTIFGWIDKYIYIYIYDNTFIHVNQSEQIKVHANQTILRIKLQSDKPESTEKQTTT